MSITRILSSGRFPWYDPDIDPSGGSASGKTSVSVKIIETLGVPWVVLLSMDNFYKSLSPAQIAAAHQNQHDFDHPNAFDYDILYDTLVNLKKGIKVDVPMYDFASHSRLETTKTIYGANVIIFEGIFALYDPKVRDLMDLKIFVDCDDDIRLARRLKRDIAERGRDLKGVLQQYHSFVKPSFDTYIHPTMAHADVILPRGLDSLASIDVITKHVLRQLNERGYAFKNNASLLEWKDKPLPDSVTVMDQKPHLLSLLTRLRDSSTPRDDFVIYSEQLAIMLISCAASLLPFDDADITTPTGHVFHGKTCTEMVCGVTIVRSGAAMERPLLKVFQEAPIGKLLIQTDSSIGEPQLHYCKLPSDIHRRYVFLNDAQCSTGAAAMMAIRVLLDHDVPQDHIIFCCFLTSKHGAHLIHGAFPDVQMVTCQVDGLEVDSNRLTTGFGCYGDRYFGTEI